MAHPYELNQSAKAQHDRRRSFVHHPYFHFIAALLLAALVLTVMLMVPNHKPPPQPHYGEYGTTPATAPR